MWKGQQIPDLKEVTLRYRPTEKLFTVIWETGIVQLQPH